VFCKVFRPVLEPTDPPIQWVPEVVLLEHQVDRSPPSIAKVKNERCHAFIACTDTALYSTQCTLSAGHGILQNALVFCKPLNLRKFVQQSYRRMYILVTYRQLRKRNVKEHISSPLGSRCNVLQTLYEDSQDQVQAKP
jgi:hypothetical protein